MKNKQINKPFHTTSKRKNYKKKNVICHASFLLFIHTLTPLFTYSFTYSFIHLHTVTSGKVNHSAMNSFCQWYFLSLPHHKEQHREKDEQPTATTTTSRNCCIVLCVTQLAPCRMNSFSLFITFFFCCSSRCYFHLLTCYSTTAVSCLYLRFINYFVSRFHFLLCSFFFPFDVFT